MDAQTFDRIARTLHDRLNRRRVLSLVSACGLAGSAFTALDVAAKKKRKKRKKRRKVKSVSVACKAADGADVYTGYQRVAQTFLAPRDGKVTAATAYLSDNPAGLALNFDFRDVDGAETPAFILGGNQVSNIPATADGDRRPVTVTFSPGVPVSAGTRYALSLFAPVQVGFLYNVNSNCPLQRSFYDQDTAGPWIADPEDYDLVFSLKIEVK